MKITSYYLIKNTSYNFLLYKIKYSNSTIRITWHEMTWHDMTWHDMTWHNITWQYDITYHSADGIASRYGLEGPGLAFRWKRDFLHTSREALDPTQLSVQLITGLSRGITMNTYPQLGPKSGSSRSLPLLPFCAFLACSKMTRTSTFLIRINVGGWRFISFRRSFQIFGNDTTIQKAR